MAQYRLGQLKEAVETLSRADQLNQGTPGDLAFLAMAHQKLGDKARAQAHLARLQETMKQERWAKDPDSQGFLGEAQALLKDAEP